MHSIKERKHGLYHLEIFLQHYNAYYADPHEICIDLWSELCFRVSNHIVKVTNGFVMLSKIATPYPSDVLSGQSQSFSKPHLHWWMKTDIMVEWSFRLLPVLWVLASQLRTTTSNIMYITENPKHPQVFLYFPQIP
mgnify:CR=1 FL=1